jgi:hypothetical protein
MFIQDFSNPKEAIAAEKQIKGWSRKKKEVLFQGNWNKIYELAKCKNILLMFIIEKISLEFTPWAKWSHPSLPLNGRTDPTYIPY